MSNQNRHPIAVAAPYRVDSTYRCDTPNVSWPVVAVHTNGERHLVVGFSEDGTMTEVLREVKSLDEARAHARLLTTRQVI